MYDVDNIHICRITPTFPSTSEPGVGLPAYHLTTNISLPTLVVTRKPRGQGTLISLPPHAEVKSYSFPDAVLSTRRSTWAGFGPLSVKLTGYLSFLMQSIPSITRFRPTIIHLHTPLPLLHGLLAKRLLKARLIIQLHGSDVRRVERNRLLQLALSRCDCVMYVSETMKSTLQSFLPDDKLMYVANGVDTQLFNDQGLPRDDQICMIGGLRWQKGYFIALNAFAILSKSQPGYRLVIVGRGPLKRQLLQEVRRMGLERNVTFIDSLDRTGIADLLNRSKVLMMSSISEGFPKVALEAAGCGTPVVATDVGSCKEVASRAGAVVPPEDPNALAGALYKLTSDENLWRKCSLAGPELAKSYDWGIIAARIKDKYIQLAGL